MCVNVCMMTVTRFARQLKPVPTYKQNQENTQKTSQFVIHILMQFPQRKFDIYVPSWATPRLSRDIL